MEDWSRLIEEAGDGGLIVRSGGLREIVSILVGHEVHPGTTKDKLLGMMGGAQSLDELARNATARLEGKVASPEEVVNTCILDIRARITVSPERLQALFSEAVFYSVREVRLELERVRAGDAAIGCLFHPMLAISAEEKRALEVKLIHESLSSDEANASCGVVLVNQAEGEGVVVQPFLNTSENLAQFKERYPKSQIYFFEV